MAGKSVHAHTLLLLTENGLLNLTVASPGEAACASIATTALDTVHQV